MLNKWGVAQGTPEILSSRAAGSKHFALPDNRILAVFEAAIHYRDPGGNWSDTDLNFYRSGNDDEVVRHVVHVKTGQEGTRILDPNTGYGIVWLTDSRPTTSGNTVGMVHGGESWSYYVSRGGSLKGTHTVTRSLGIKQYSFPYQLQGGADPLVLDAEGHARSSGFKVARTVIQRADGFAHYIPWEIDRIRGLVFSFDDRILPPEAYPYIIDPTTNFDIGTGADDGSSAGNESATFKPPWVTANSTDVDFQVSNRNLGTPNYYYYQGFVRWDTSSISPNIVDSATFRFRAGTITDDDSRSLIAEYYDHGGTIDSGDYDTGADVSDGFSDTLASLTGSAENTVTVDNVGSISTSGTTGFRLRVSGAAPANNTSNSIIGISSLEHATDNPPRLSVVHSAATTVRRTLFF